MVLVVTMRTSSYINYYVLCLVCWILLGITGVSTRSYSLVRRHAGIYQGPYFDEHSPKNCTAQLGTNTFLPCKVRQLGNKSVSWIRRRDAHILSVDRIMFIADERFQTIYVDGSDTWTLGIKYVQARDEGEYECQISTEQKMSHTVYLSVIVPKIEIMGDQERHVKTGSTVTLRCVINQSVEAPSYVFWYHDDSRVLSDQYGKVSIHPPERTENGFDSVLTIHNAKLEDSGNYTCSPSNLDSASIHLHVLNGEHPAAIQRGISAAPGGCRALWWLAGSVSLSSNQGKRIFVLIILLIMVLITNPRSIQLGYAVTR
ncbi:hemicentin-1-like [Chelonus insularis]|uniref:hemicentin-1-like n=1 Tax=Chelonus insularis TaxID=460826 RepID=UPI00158C34B3|nr:hemicentin-1-like [Chelonus insularis]XP_034943734.1 hemicentin-1-like [Chelonus insularis]XP_034943735.1 hemicentin-1-like [Chelonus insularis]XP_034943737.1 hemicentin-1-like [Chelonus insularis]XP_034943738.1 hemicentin-1-like [Chelonus insularis]XP_034943739.1 hemicentin-1-like [Chelonus insularis]